MSEVDLLMQYLLNGDLLGFIVACYTTRIGQLFYAILSILFVGPLYIRTRSIILLGIIWILLGSFFIVAMPIVSPIAIFLLIMGVGAMLYKLFTSIR